jgi:hypothetical protein
LGGWGGRMKGREVGKRLRDSEMVDTNECSTNHQEQQRRFHHLPTLLRKKLKERAFNERRSPAYLTTYFFCFWIFGKGSKESQRALEATGGISASDARSLEDRKVNRRSIYLYQSFHKTPATPIITHLGNSRTYHLGRDRKETPIKHLQPTLML